MDILRDKLWLVKVPEVIYDQILKEKNLGVLDVYEFTNSAGEKETEIKINLAGKIDPKFFDITCSKTENFFTYKDKKNKIRTADYLCRFVASDERVSDRVTMEVSHNELTNKACVAREYGKGRPQSDGVIPISVHQYFANNNNWQQALSQKNRKDKNLKKTRMPIDELKTEIFNLFTEKDYWTNKELVAKLDQPENYLKEVLQEMCNYIKSGPKKGCYELKPQYLRSKEDEEMNLDN